VRPGRGRAAGPDRELPRRLQPEGGAAVGAGPAGPALQGQHARHPPPNARRRRADQEAVLAGLSGRAGSRDRRRQGLGRRLLQDAAAPGQQAVRAAVVISTLEGQTLHRDAFGCSGFARSRRSSSCDQHVPTVRRLLPGGACPRARGRACHARGRVRVDQEDHVVDGLGLWRTTELDSAVSVSVGSRVVGNERLRLSVAHARKPGSSDAVLDHPEAHRLGACLAEPGVVLVRTHAVRVALDRDVFDAGICHENRHELREQVFIRLADDGVAGVELQAFAEANLVGTHDHLGRNGGPTLKLKVASRLRAVMLGVV
jgi:hypothetical protein